MSVAPSVYFDVYATTFEFIRWLDRLYRLVFFNDVFVMFMQLHLSLFDGWTNCIILYLNNVFVMFI